MIYKIYAEKVLHGLSILFLAISIPCHGTVLEENFLDTETGFEPENATVTGTGWETTVKVVKYPVPDAPFKEGKGLQFTKTETGTTPLVKWTLPHFVTEGQLKFRAYSLHSTGKDGEDYGQTYFVVYLWDGELTPISLIFHDGNVRLYDGEVLLTFKEEAYPSLGLAGNTIDVEVVFSAEKQTYSVTINDTEIWYNGKSEFLFQHPAKDGFNAVSFGIPGKEFNKLRMYLDSFQVTEY